MFMLTYANSDTQQTHEHTHINHKVRIIAQIDSEPPEEQPTASSAAEHGHVNSYSVINVKMVKNRVHIFGSI